MIRTKYYLLFLPRPIAFKLNLEKLLLLDLTINFTSTPDSSSKQAYSDPCHAQGVVLGPCRAFEAEAAALTAVPKSRSSITIEASLLGLRGCVHRSLLMASAERSPRCILQSPHLPRQSQITNTPQSAHPCPKLAAPSNWWGCYPPQS